MPPEQPSKPARHWSVWAYPAGAFIGGALAGLLILTLLPNGPTGEQDSPSVVSRGTPIQTLDSPDTPPATSSADSANASTRNQSSPFIPAHPEKYEEVLFDRLAGFEILAQPGRGLTHSPEPQWILNQVPEEIRQLDGQPVAIEGFMLPLRTDMRRGNVTEMALMKSHAMCCFGEVPDYHEFVLVKMKPGHEVDILMEEPVRVWGELSIREVGQGGLLYGIYHLSGTGLQRR